MFNAVSAKTQRLADELFAFRYQGIVHLSIDDYDQEEEIETKDSAPA